MGLNSMNWQDILKNVITQGRVKEIEDIDIDIEDDDCRRWYDKLLKIVDRINLLPDDSTVRLGGRGVYSYLPLEVDEQTACLIKEDMTHPHSASTKIINMKNRAKETYEKTGFMTGFSVNRAKNVRQIFHLFVYNLVDRLGDKRDSEYGETGLDLYFDWRGNKKGAKLTLVINEEDIKRDSNNIKELLRHIEQSWAIDVLTNYGVFK